MKLEFYTSRTEFNYNDYERSIILSDITELIDVFGYLLNTFMEKEINVKHYQYPITTLLNKFSIHIYSIISLAKGITVQSEYLGFRKKIIDISSIYSLTRTVIENYLTFFYLYVQPQNHKEGDFRFHLFELAGLKSRQRMRAEGEEEIQLKEKDKIKIKELENALYRHPLFLGLNKTTRDNIKGRNSAKILNWEKLFSESDLRTELFLTSWYIYSEHVHSEYISQIQVYGFLSEEISPTSAIDNVSVLLLSIISITAKDLCGLFREINNRYSLLGRDVAEVIDFFDNLGRK